MSIICELYMNEDLQKHTLTRFSSESLLGGHCRRRILRDYQPVAVAALSAGCSVSLALVVGFPKG